MKVSSRGTHVSITRALFRGPDFQKLRLSARWTFVCLKSNMSGMAGIDNIYPAELEAKLLMETGGTAKQVTEDLSTLEHAGWVRREGSVVWVVDHLTYDPYAHVRDVNKRKGVQQHVAGLPRLGIVRAYVAYHYDWFPADECAGSHLDWALNGAESETPVGLLEESGQTPRATLTVTVPVTVPTNSAVPAGGGGGKSQKSYSAHFLEVWPEYPVRSGSNPKDKAAAQFEARLAEGVPFDLLLDKTREYKRWADATKKVNTDLVMQASRFYGASREYETGNWTIPPSNGKAKAAANRSRGYV